MKCYVYKRMKIFAINKRKREEKNPPFNNQSKSLIFALVYHVFNSEKGRDIHPQFLPFSNTGSKPKLSMPWQNEYHLLLNA